MSNFSKPGAGIDQAPGARDAFPQSEHPDGDLSPARAARASLSEHLGRVSRWFQGIDDESEPGGTEEWDLMYDPAPGEPAPEAPRRLSRTRLTRTDRAPRTERRPRSEHASVPSPEYSDDVAPRFPLAPFGYNRLAVEQQLAELERALSEREHELIELREQEKPPMSISEEIERLGEQTASILVVAHDQAHETTRRAREQAERCIADAAANAIEITAEAKARLHELDEETDSVWRERERLLEDTRTVSAHLAALVQEAEGRFPADGGRPAASAAGSAAGSAARSAAGPAAER